MSELTWEPQLDVASMFRRRGLWVLKYRDATGRWRSPSFPTKRRAEDALAGVVEQRRQPSVSLVDPDITIQAYSERWLNLVSASLKSSTVESYHQRLRVHIRPAFGALQIRQLHRGLIKSLLAEKLNSGLAVDTVRLIHATIRAMLNAAVDDGVILANPANRLEARRYVWCVRRGRGRRRSRRSIGGRHRTSSRRLSPTCRGSTRSSSRCRAPGCGSARALALQWSDLDFHARRAAEGTIVPKGDMRPWVFPSDAWTPMDHANVGKAFKRVLKAAGLPLHHSPHSLRHTFASLLLQQGEAIQYVQRMLGHASITLTVDTYGKWLPMGNKAAVDSADEPQISEGGGKLVADATPASKRRLQVVDVTGDPPRTRTLNPEIKSLLLYH